MATKDSIPSNKTVLRIAEESSFKTLGGAPTWLTREPNSYSGFSQNVEKVMREDINADRQRRKGTTVDVEGSGGWNEDLTQDNWIDLLQGVFWADVRVKQKVTITAANDGTPDSFTVDSGGDDYLEGDIIFVEGMDTEANNGIHVVATGGGTSTDIPVDSTLTAETGQSATGWHVGFEFASGDAEIDASGDLPALTTTSKDLTQLGLIEGLDYIHIGGDLASSKFDTADNKGFARVRSVSANSMTLDETDNTLATDAGGTQEVRIFFGPQVFKNEQEGSQKRRTYTIERELGAPDDASPNDKQAEYLRGALLNELTVNIPGQDKITLDLSVIAGNYNTIDGATALESDTGTKEAAKKEDPYNTSKHPRKLKVYKISSTDANPTALYAFAQQLSIVINNNVSLNKAVSVEGAFEATEGQFSVSASFTAYFNLVAQQQSIRDNDDIGLVVHNVKDNAGHTLSIPLAQLSDGSNEVTGNEPITASIELEAFDGSSIHSNLNYSLAWIAWKYLPDIAEI